MCPLSPAFIQCARCTTVDPHTHALHCIDVFDMLPGPAQLHCEGMEGCPAAHSASSAAPPAPAAASTQPPASSLSQVGQHAEVDLLPELAQLQFLEELCIELRRRVPAGLPSDWGLPGAFPRLDRWAWMWAGVRSCRWAGGGALWVDGRHESRYAAVAA